MSTEKYMACPSDAAFKYVMWAQGGLCRQLHQVWENFADHRNKNFSLFGSSGLLSEHINFGLSRYWVMTKFDQFQLWERQLQKYNCPCSLCWCWRLLLEWCERKTLLAGWWLLLEWCERKTLLAGAGAEQVSPISSVIDILDCSVSLIFFSFPSLFTFPL